jgi:hypothetical protein
MISNQFVAIKIAICLLHLDVSHAAVNALSLLLKDVILRLSSQLTEEMSSACRELLSLAFGVSIERGDRVVFTQNDIARIHSSSILTPTSISPSSPKTEQHVEAAVSNVAQVATKLNSPRKANVNIVMNEDRIFIQKSYRPESVVITTPPVDPQPVTTPSTNFSDISTPSTNNSVSFLGAGTEREFTPITPRSLVGTSSLGVMPTRSRKASLLVPVKKPMTKAGSEPVLLIHQGTPGDIEPDVDKFPAVSLVASPPEPTDLSVGSPASPATLVETPDSLVGLSSPDEELSPSIPLEEVIENEEYHDIYTKFVMYVERYIKKDFYLIEFLREVKEFEEETGTTESALQARELIDHFISPEATTRVQLAESVQHEILSEFELNALLPRKTLFAPAVRAAIQNLGPAYEKFESGAPLPVDLGSLVLIPQLSFTGLK